MSKFYQFYVRTGMYSSSLFHFQALYNQFANYPRGGAIQIQQAGFAPEMDQLDM